MRILVVSQYFWPENFRVNDLVAELVERGHRVTVLTGKPNYPEGDLFPEYVADIDKYSSYEGADIVRVPLIVRGRSKIRLALNFLSFAVNASTIGMWRLRKKNYDLVFAFMPSPATVGIPAAVISLAKRIPLVVWVLDIWPDTLSAVGAVRSAVILSGIGAIVRCIYRRSSLILAQSMSFVGQISHLAGKHVRVEYFPSWAEEVFSTERAAPAAEVPVDVESFNVLFAGNIGESQDFPAILEAASIARANGRIRWLIVGDGRAAPWVSMEIERRGLEGCVLMLGRFPLARMPSFFKHADALLVSLRDEPVFAMTIPGKLQAYLASGVPIVAMMNGEGAEVVRRAQCGVACSAGDSAALAEAVVELSGRTREERADMGRRGIQLSVNTFGRKKLITQLEKWMAELA